MYLDSLPLIHIAYFVKIVRCEINHISLGKSAFSVHKYDFNRASFRVLRHVWLCENISDDVLNRARGLTDHARIKSKPREFEASLMNAFAIPNNTRRVL